MFFAGIGYIAAFCGLAAGTGLMLFFGELHRIKAILSGFAAGILIAFVCFQMLSQVFSSHGIIAGSIGILIGVAISTLLEAKFGGNIFAAGIILHGLPEGIALGSLLSNDFSAGIYMSLILAAHCLPEALAYSAYMQRKNTGRLKIFLSAFVLAAPVGLGAALGGVFNEVLPAISSICFAFAGGVMLYLACGEALPESENRKQCLFTLISACAGFAAGVWLTGLC